MPFVCLNPFDHKRASCSSFKKPIISAGFLLLGVSALAQSYYPGGIGRDNLIMWLNASRTSSITSNSGVLSAWNDLSGRSFHFTQGTASRRPSYSATAGPSSRGAVTFDGDDDEYLSTVSIPAAYTFTSGVTTMSVANFSASASSAGYERLFDFGNGSESNNIWMGRRGTTANICYESRVSTTTTQAYATSNNLPNNANRIYEVQQVGGTAGNYSNVFHYISGVSQAGNGTNGSKTMVPAGVIRANNYIGRSNWAVDDYYTGTMSEFLLYNTYQNETRRIILENYLGAGWNLSVNTSIYTPPSTTTYYANLVGIGRISASDNFLADVAGSTDGLGFSSGTTSTDFLNTNGYIAAAHNKQTNTILTSQNITSIGNGLSRWNRSWYVHRTSGTSTGYLTLSFHFSDYNGTTPPGTWAFGILYNASNGAYSSGTNSVITHAGISQSGSIISFRVRASALADGYYTLVWGTSTLLPVTLSSFKVTQQTSANLLQWTLPEQVTYTSCNIQRSSDGNNYQTIGSVNTGNGTGIYSYADNTPAAGKSYYRLQFTQQDGSVVYSTIVMTNRWSNKEAALTYAANPVKDVLSISGEALTGNATIRVYNLQGQIVKTVQSYTTGTINIPLNNIMQGIYVVKVYTDDKIFTHRFIKE